MKGSLRERFLAKATVDLWSPRPVDEAPCWNWTAYTHESGYGHLFQYGRGAVGAHVVAYIFWYGMIPTGLQVDHVCRNRSCVNPAHLEAVTPRENQRRRYAVLPPRVPRLPRIRGPHSRDKTHCPRGHPYDEENTYRYSGRRCCRACNRDAVRRYKERLEQS